MARSVARCSSTRAAVSTARGSDSAVRSTWSATAGDGQGGRAHGVEVAESAVGLLQVGLEKEGDVAVGAVALVDLGGEHREPRAGPGPPLVEGPGEHGLGHRGVAGDDPAVEQPELGPKVLAGHLEDLGRAAHGVVEADALVPHRVPDGVGHPTDVAPPAVDEDHVEIAVGAQLAPPVPAHGDQGETLRFPVGRLVEQAGQPLVGGRRERGAEGLAVEVRSRQQLLAQRSQGHGRR